MNKKLQVFVSSTYDDLQEERQAAVQAILDAGHIPAGMELFKAGNDSQLKTIYRWIDESDVYMLILGGRYGSIEPKSGKSYTQLEYEYALKNNIPSFTVVLSDAFLTAKINLLKLPNVMEQKAPDKYQEFKSLAMSKPIRKVDDCKDIKIAIHTTLSEFINEHALTGWVRDTICEDAMDKFISLYTLFDNYMIYPAQKMNANIFLIEYIEQFVHGVSDQYCPSTYKNYTSIYVKQNILKRIITDNYETLIISDFGLAYFRFLAFVMSKKA